MRWIEHGVQDINEFLQFFNVLAFSAEGVPYGESEDAYSDLGLYFLPDLLKESRDCVDSRSLDFCESYAGDISIRGESDIIKSNRLHAVGDDLIRNGQ